jgi:GNAT superfamily N-acetyltransferase
MKEVHMKIIQPLAHKAQILPLLAHLNPKRSPSYIENTLIEMAQQPNYHAFGLFYQGELVGLSSGWTTVRMYCGKHLELDNVIIDPEIQSKGFGKHLLESIKNWATAQGYIAIGLNTYVSNARSHKFYFNQGYNVLGFHFEKDLSA